MAVYKRDIVDINLETGNIHRSWLKHSIGYKDQKADHFGVRTYRDGAPVDLTGVSVQGVFLPPQGDPIAITSGNIVSGNVAEVVLPQACYNYDGQFTLAIKLVDSNNNVTGTVRIVDGMVDNTHASGTVAPTSAVPTYQEILSTYNAMIAATAAANGAIAATYSSSSTYAVGDYCIHDGGLYRCTTAITTGEAWTAGHWTAAKLGPDLSDLKSALSAEDTTVNDALSYINYGYDKPFYQAEDSEQSTWQKRTGLKRDGQVIVLNKQFGINVAMRIKISGDVEFAGNTSGVAAWSTGVSLKAEHEYAVICKLIGGSSTNGGETQTPPVSVYKTGTSTNCGSSERIGNVYKRTFIAEDAQYNIAFSIPSGEYIFTNAKVLVVLLDNSESKLLHLEDRESDNEEKIHELSSIVSGLMPIEPKVTLYLRSGGINTNGSNTDDNTRIRSVGGSSKKPIPTIENADFYNVTEPYEAKVAIYTSNSIVTSTFVAWVNDNWRTGMIVIPEIYTGDHAAIVIRKKGYEDSDISEDVEIITKYITYSNPKMGSFESIPNATVSMFGKIGACGASWETGVYYYGDQEEEHESDYNVSWVTNLARRNGILHNIYASGGLNTKTWLTNPNGLTKMINDTPCNLYITAFGRSNDSNRGLDKLGTISDIGTDADTYFRYYGEIIESIKEHAPNALIIMTCNDGTTEVRHAYYDATIEISEHYGLPFIDWKDDAWYSGEYRVNNMNFSHPTPAVYSGIASCFERLFSDCVAKYSSYFKAYHPDNPDRPVTT